MEMKDDDRLYSDPALVDFYDLDNGWADDQETCVRMAQDAASVLDLGCGTGHLCAELVQRLPEIVCVGVDPAAAMLDIARARPGGDHVTWVEADARMVRLGQTFDLIVLTGHAFQVFLTEQDQAAALRTIATHLSPQGRFIFDSRNPLKEAWKSWANDGADSTWQVDHPVHGTVDAWTDAWQDHETGVVTYETHYCIRKTGQHLSAESHIRFSDKETIERLIERSDLMADKWLGSWQGDQYTSESKEIIPVGTFRKQC